MLIICPFIQWALTKLCNIYPNSREIYLQMDSIKRGLPKNSTNNIRDLKLTTNHVYHSIISSILTKKETDIGIYVGDQSHEEGRLIL